MIHFAHPIRGGSLCGAKGDVRWIRSAWAKASVCAQCWSLRPRIIGVQTAMGRVNRPKLLEKEMRLVEWRAKQQARARREEKKKKAGTKQLSLWDTEEKT